MQLDAQEAATARFLDGFPDPTWSVDPTGRLCAWNRAAESVLGLPASAALGRYPQEVLGTVPQETGPVDLRDADGRPVGGSAVLWSDGDLRHTSVRVCRGDVGVVSRRLLEGLLEHVGDAIVTVDVQGVVQLLNKGAERLYGVRAADLVGRHVRGLCRDDDGIEEYLDAVRRELVAGRTWSGVEVELVTAGGRSIVVESAATALFDGHGGYAGAVLVSRDVTPVRELEQSLRAATRALRDRAAQMAKATHRDALTGVAARSLLQERLSAALGAAADADEPVCVLAADLDGFRAVNDSYGLAAGDALLIAFAAHLRSALPPSATAGRLGADEFAVVLPGTGEEQAERIAAVVREWTPPAPLPARGRRADDRAVGVTVGVVRATPLECRSPFDTGVRSVLQRVEDAVARQKGGDGDSRRRASDRASDTAS
ncbi:diguanylate cyclase [Kineococcus endophyticus]|uniref:Diguanylate cyclase n=1 Tax=Kineococcus endophyticus TaxID=1181883 RepID=A0ABV3PAN4_9ACTN